MTRCDDLGQFDLNTLINLLPTDVKNTVRQTAGTVSSTIETVQNLANNPLSAAIKSVSFWTDYSPQLTYSGKQLETIYNDPTPNPYLRFIKPTIVLDTIMGKRTIAPYGVADPLAWKDNVRTLTITSVAVGVIGVTGLLLLGGVMGRARKAAIR